MYGLYKRNNNMRDIMKFSDLETYNIGGIFALIEPSSKKIYIGHSVNILSSLIFIIKHYKTNKAYGGIAGILDQLQPIVLETINDNDSKRFRLRIAHWTDKYTAEGWTLLRPYKGLRYTLKTFIGVDSKIYVQATSHTSDKIVLGIFDFITQADRFRDKYYPKGVVAELVYANNALTRQYWLTKKRK